LAVAWLIISPVEVPMRARVLTSTLVFALVASAAAQTPAPPQGPLLVLSVIDVKPDMFAEFGELQARTMEAQRKGGLAWRETWNVAQFGLPYRVGVLRPLTSFAELDGQPATVKGAGADQARVINERARRMIVAQQIYALRVRLDLGYGNRPAEPTLVVLSTIAVAPGRNADFEGIVKSDIIPGHKDAGEPYLAASQVVLGGNTNQYLFVTPYSDFASLQKGNPLLRGLGPERFARFTQKLAGVVTNVDQQVMRFNPALSFRQPAASPR
jgi:hypothetical protein